MLTEKNNNNKQFTLSLSLFLHLLTLVSNQASVIEQLRNSNKLALAVGSENNEVKKYIAKTVAYLSLRNGKMQKKRWGKKRIYIIYYLF